MSKHSEKNYYANAFKNWVTKLMGPKPTLEQITAAHAAGCRPGKQALAMAMYQREAGASDGQVKAACIAGWGSSGSHHNKRRDLVKAGYFKTKPLPADGAGHKVYAVTLTPKGEGKVKAVAEAPKAKPAKKAPAKPATVKEPLPGLPAEAQTPAQA